MTTRVSQPTPIVGFYSQQATSSSQAFIRALQTKQHQTFNLAGALKNRDFLKAFIQESRELLRKEKSDENLVTVILGIALIKELHTTETHELVALHVGCWMELYQEDKAFQIINALSRQYKAALSQVISRIVQDPTDPLYDDYLRIQKIISL